MAIIYPAGGSTNPYDESDITARASDVLVTKYTLDNNGDLVLGTITHDNTGTVKLTSTTTSSTVAANKYLDAAHNVYVDVFSWG